MEAEHTFNHAEERMLVLFSMMITGGMMGAYTYVCRGGVFCNAQTGNLLMLAMELGEGHWKGALYYLIPFCAYFAGSLFSEMVRDENRVRHFVKWNTTFTFLEICIFLAIGFVPLSVPDQIIQVIITFIAAMQYNSFRKVHHIPVATTFCTNHVRQAAIWLYRFISRKKSSDLTRSAIHLIMLACFAFGAAIVTFCASFLQEKAIWLALLPLSVSFWILFQEDKTILTEQSNARKPY